MIFWIQSVTFEWCLLSWSYYNKKRKFYANKEKLMNIYEIFTYLEVVNINTKAHFHRTYFLIYFSHVYVSLCVIKVMCYHYRKVQKLRRVIFQHPITTVMKNWSLQNINDSILIWECNENSNLWNQTVLYSNYGSATSWLCDPGQVAETFKPGLLLQKNEHHNSP